MKTYYFLYMLIVTFFIKKCNDFIPYFMIYFIKSNIFHATHVCILGHGWHVFFYLFSAKALFTALTNA